MEHERIGPDERSGIEQRIPESERARLHRESDPRIRERIVEPGSFGQSLRSVGVTLQELPVDGEIILGGDPSIRTADDENEIVDSARDKGFEHQVGDRFEDGLTVRAAVEKREELLAQSAAPGQHPAALAGEGEHAVHGDYRTGAVDVSGAVGADGSEGAEGGLSDRDRSSAGSAALRHWTAGSTAPRFASSRRRSRRSSRNSSRITSRSSRLRR